MVEHSADDRLAHERDGGGDAEVARLQRRDAPARLDRVLRVGEAITETGLGRVDVPHVDRQAVEARGSVATVGLRRSDQLDDHLAGAEEDLLHPPADVARALGGEPDRLEGRLGAIAVGARHHDVVELGAPVRVLPRLGDSPRRSTVVGTPSIGAISSSPASDHAATPARLSAAEASSGHVADDALAVVVDGEAGVAPASGSSAMVSSARTGTHGT